MSISTVIKYDAVRQTTAHNSPAPRRHQLDNRILTWKKMADLNFNALNHQQRSTGNGIYENFRGSRSPTQTTNTPKQSPQSQVRSRQMNGWAAGDSAAAPGSPGTLQDYQQTVSALHGELKESRLNEARLQTMLKQQMALYQPHQENGSSLTLDGLPAAPSSDGIGESVKDGHIRRLGRELTLLKAKLHEEETRSATAQKECNSAVAQVASLSSLLAESEQRSTNLQRQVAELKSALGEMHLHRQEVAEAGAGREDRITALTEMMDKQKAEISTLKESLQRLSRENATLKQNEGSGASRQSGSLGSGGSSSVACSQELEYLHKVVDTLKATVLEQHGKLRSLRFPRSRINQAASNVSQPIEVQSFPVASVLSATHNTAGVGGSMRLAGTGGRIEGNVNFDWSIDGAATQQEAVSKPATVATTVTPSNNLGAVYTSNPSPKTPHITQDVEMTRSSASDNVPEKLSVPHSKYIPGISQGEERADPKGVAGGAIANPGYYQPPQNLGIWAPRGNSVNPANLGAVSRANAVYESALAAPRGKAQSQVIASSRVGSSSSPSHDASGSRLPSKSEVIAVSSGLRQPTLSTNITTQAATAGLSTVTSQDMLKLLGMRPSPPPALTSRAGGTVTASQVLAPQLPVTTGMVGVGAVSSLMQMPQAAQPQFMFEAEVEPQPGVYPAVGATNLEQLSAGHPQQQRLPTFSSVGFAPQQAAAPIPSSSSVLSNFQTASDGAASTPDRDHVQVINKRMMGGGNVIFQQDPVYVPQQVPFGTTLPLNQQNVALDARALSPNQQQQQHQGPSVNVNNPSNPQAGNPPGFSQSSQGQEQDVSEPRCNSDRLCPVCGQDFSHVPMEEFQAHVFECFDEAGPETMKASGEERMGGGSDNRSADRTCPVCNKDFDPSVLQADFERHVHSHFGEENFEILS